MQALGFAGHGFAALPILVPASLDLLLCCLSQGVLQGFGLRTPFGSIAVLIW